jgi:hypothetical protein
MKTVSFSLESGNKYFAKIDGGSKFLVGSRVPYLGNKGLMNTSGTPAQQYDRAAYRPKYGFWADFIHPTAMGEGKYYHTLNTYDDARFTFAFLQFAAHVPNGDFVTYFRKLLTLPEAKDYFPDLAIDNGRICKMVDGSETPLETDTTTEPLMDYFNPTATEVEDTEVIQSAKLVDWSEADDHRDLQVDVGIAEFKKKMPVYAKWYPMLNGSPAAVCLMVADIHHQGRAKVGTVLAALNSADPLGSLLKIGEPNYHDRLVTLRKEIKALTDDGTFGGLKYNASKNDFE